MLLMIFFCFLILLVNREQLVAGAITADAIIQGKEEAAVRSAATRRNDISLSGDQKKFKHQNQRGQQELSLSGDVFQESTSAFPSSTEGEDPCQVYNWNPAPCTQAMVKLGAHLVGCSYCCESGQCRMKFDTTTGASPSCNALAVIPYNSSRHMHTCDDNCQMQFQNCSSCITQGKTWCLFCAARDTTQVCLSKHSPQCEDPLVSACSGGNNQNNNGDDDTSGADQFAKILLYTCIGLIGFCVLLCGFGVCRKIQAHRQYQREEEEEREAQREAHRRREEHREQQHGSSAALDSQVQPLLLNSERDSLLGHASTTTTNGGTETTSSSDVVVRIPPQPENKNKEREETKNVAPEVDDVPEEEACQLCLEKRANIIFLPCYHTYCCEECSEKIRPTRKKFLHQIHCPFCRQPIEAMINGSKVPNGMLKERGK